MIEGYKNLIKRKSDIELVAKQRLSICSSCPHKKAGICTLCGCILAAKTRELDQKCKIGKW